MKKLDFLALLSSLSFCEEFSFIVFYFFIVFSPACCADIRGGSGSKFGRGLWLIRMFFLRTCIRLFLHQTYRIPAVCFLYDKRAVSLNVHAGFKAIFCIQMRIRNFEKSSTDLHVYSLLICIHKNLSFNWFLYTLFLGGYMEMNEVISVRVSKKIRDRLDEVAKRKGTTVSDIARDIITQGIQGDDLKSYLRVGFNKNLYMTLRVMYGNDNAKIESEYNQYKLT